MGRQMRESSAVQARAEAVRLRDAQRHRHRQPRRPDGGQQPPTVPMTSAHTRPCATAVASPGSRRPPGERVEVERGERGAIAVDIGEGAPDGAASSASSRASIITEPRPATRRSRRAQGGDLHLAARDGRVHAVKGAEGCADGHEGGHRVAEDVGCPSWRPPSSSYVPTRTWS